jgi:hypothetical protein
MNYPNGSTCYKDRIKEAIEFNHPIDDKLNVIICISNPCNYKRRYQLAKEFIQRMECEPNINLYIVELIYIHLTNDFQITDKNNNNHLQLKTDTAPLWHKENLLNIGIQYLLPSDWKAVAWIDADIEFDSPHWVTDTLKLLNSFDIVQLFSHALDLDQNNQVMNIFSGFGYQHYHKRPYQKGGTSHNQWHPGYGFACTREAYNQMTEFFQFGIIGAGDHHMTLSWIDKGMMSVNENISNGYIRFTFFNIFCIFRSFTIEIVANTLILKATSSI